jgi:hypothetical protein
MHRLLHLLTAAVGTSRHFAEGRKFGRFWIEADIAAGFMSTRPSVDWAGLTEPRLCVCTPIPPEHIGLAGELLHLADDGGAHLGGADDVGAFRFDVGGAQALGERRGDRGVQHVGLFVHGE